MATMLVEKEDEERERESELQGSMPCSGWYG